MTILEKIISDIKNVQVTKLYNALIRKGKIIKFDENFYSKFDGMYYNGLPIYYYLRELNMGKCYDTSAILALAMGKDNYVCRGELHAMTAISREYFDHGWVEDEEFVYDTTWQIIAPRKIYYKLFNVKGIRKTKHEEFFEMCKGISSWKIKQKEDFEKEHTLDTMLIILVKALETQKLEDKTLDEKQREFSLKVLNDLPRIEHLRPLSVSECIAKKKSNSR